MSELEDKLKLALKLHQQGDIDQAALHYKQVLETEPQHPEALHLLGVIASQTGQFEQAAIFISQAIQYHPKPPAHFYINLGNLRYQQQNWREALHYYQSALELNPEDLEIRYKVASLYESLEEVEQAVPHFLKILEKSPEHPEALEIYNILGMFFQENNQLEQALEYYKQGLKIEPEASELYNNIGSVFEAQNDLDQAIEYYLLALKHNPDIVEARYNLGFCYQNQGKVEQALASYEKVLKMFPEHLQALFCTAHLYQFIENWERAIHFWKQVLIQQPQNIQVKLNLGISLEKNGQLQESISYLEQVLPSHRKQQEFLIFLSRLYYCTEQFQQAEPLLLEALEIGPISTDLYLKIGANYHNQGLLTAAITYYQKALSLEAERGDIYANLGTALREQARIEEALEAYKKGLDFQAGTTSVYYSNYLVCLQARSNLKHKDYFQALKEWEVCTQIQTPLRDFRATQLDPEKPLRVGYVSPDFRSHAASNLFIHLFQHHEREQIEIYAYSETLKVDEDTKRFKECSNQWFQTEGMNHEAIAQQIMNDKIDILVDLAGHTAGNRLAVFQLRPAPVQVTFAGSISSTGLSVMDYRLADPEIVPLPTVQYGSEKVIFLSNLMNWPAPNLDVPIKGLPFEQNGFITFGSGNTLYKVNEEVYQLWLTILEKNPTSLLHLKAKQFNDLETQQLFLEQAKPFGAEKRIRFSGSSSKAEHMNFYNQIDIALDPFPYQGGITSCEALWMGVPVITHAIGPFAGMKPTPSIVSHCGFPQWVVQSKEEYLELATAMANQPEQLLYLRQNLRRTLLQSPICNGQLFTREVENAYRVMWRKYCSSHAL